MFRQVRVPHTVIDLDLAQVAEIDTAGLQLLLLCCQIATTIGGALRLINPTPAVSDLVRLLALQGHFARAAAHCPECLAHGDEPAGGVA